MTRLAWIVAMTTASLCTAATIAVGCGVDATGEASPFDAGANDGERPEASLPDASVPVSDGAVDATIDAPDASEGGTDAGLQDGQAIDGGVVADSPPGGNTQSLPCGDVKACPIPGAACCAYPAAGSTAYQCVGGSCPVGDGPQTAWDLRCSGAANCPLGTVCCLSAIAASQGVQAYRSECRVTCLAQDAQLCDPAAKTTGCLITAPCGATNIGAWGLPASWGTCGDQAP